MNSIVDDVNTMSVAAESHTYMLKHRSQSPNSGNHSGTPTRRGPASPTGECAELLKMDTITRSIREIEKTV